MSLLASLQKQTKCNTKIEPNWNVAGHCQLIITKTWLTADVAD